jgi:hypothetical protein
MIVTILVLAVGGYLGACVLAGFAAPLPLASFSADGRALTRQFADPVLSVMAAYLAAAEATPGMRVAETGHDVLLVDSRPTSRVLGGNFGMVIRVQFAPDADGCTARAEAMNKVPFAVLANHDAAFVHAERALRMAAKAHGLREVVSGV